MSWQGALKYAISNCVLSPKSGIRQVLIMHIIVETLSDSLNKNNTLKQNKGRMLIDYNKGSNAYPDRLHKKDLSIYFLQNNILNYQFYKNIILTVV